MLLHLSPNSLTSTSSLSPLTPSLSLLFHSRSHSLSPHSLTLPPYLPDLALSPLSNYLSPPLSSFYSLPTLSFPLSPYSHSLSPQSLTPSLSLSLSPHSLPFSPLSPHSLPISVPSLSLHLPYFLSHSLTHPFSYTLLSHSLLSPFSLSLPLFFGSYNCNNYK